MRAHAHPSMQLCAHFVLGCDLSPPPHTHTTTTIPAPLAPTPASSPFLPTPSRGLFNSLNDIYTMVLTLFPWLVVELWLCDMTLGGYYTAASIESQPGEGNWCWGYGV